MRFKTHTHPRFHLNLEIVHTMSSNRIAVLDMGAWSSISLPRCFAGAYLWTLVLWERLSRKPGLPGSAPGSFHHPSCGSTECGGSFCLQLIIVLSQLILMITWWLREIFLHLVMRHGKKHTVILLTSWILIDLSPNNSQILCTSHHSQRLFYLDLKMKS